jgi:acetyl esterase/lipase
MDTVETRSKHDVKIEDIEYQRQGGQKMLARLYQPSGSGPFPASLQVHGGAWTSKDRTDNDYMAKALAESGIVVLSIDFRMPPVAPYPALLQDVNLGVRFLKAHAKDFRSRPEWVGSWGTSSGGHVVLLAGMRPHDARYSALPGPTGVDATQAWVISGWGVLDPLLRYNLAKQVKNAGVVANHDAFWVTEDAMSEGSPPLMLERGEKVALPPAMVFGGDADEWVPVELMRKFVADYVKAGGKGELVLYPKANHQFITGKPDAPFAKPALDAMKAFIRKHTA